MIHAEAQDYAVAVTRLTAATRRGRRTVLDLPYGPDPRHRLDLYLPSGAAGPAPVLVFFHGGAWRNGSKDWTGFLADRLVDLPAVLVCPSYRLAPDTPFPGALEDVLQALAWTHATIARYGGDAGRIMVGGHSAGGHLAALAVLRTDLWENADLPPGAIRGCCPLSAPFDLREIAPDDPSYAAINDDFLRDPENAPLASPLVYAGRATQPFLIAYGDGDFPRVRRQGPEMVAALTAYAGVGVRELVIPGSSHFETHATCTQPGHPWAQQLRAFLRTGKV